MTDTPPKPKSERCETCRFWKHWRPTTSAYEAHGYCRRRPPVIAGIYNLVNGEADAMGVGNIAEATWFPATHEDDWCGDFEWIEALEPMTGC